MVPQIPNVPAERLKGSGSVPHGTIAEELAADRAGFSAGNVPLLRRHGIFQQDNRDERYRCREQIFGRRYEFMVRVRATGGKLTASQLLLTLELADEYCNSRVRITSRQGMQLEGVDKSALKTVLRRLAQAGLTTLAGSGGALHSNVMCCPVPLRRDRVHDQLQFTADQISAWLVPSSRTYEEIWLGGDSEIPPHGDSHSPNGNGEALLSQKFKVGLATPEDNCADVYAQDVGLLAVIEDERIIGYNMLVGGSMGMIIGVKGRLPALAQPMAFVGHHEILPLLAAIVRVYRKFGERKGQTKVRVKHLIRAWGFDRFTRAVEEQFGHPLNPPRHLNVIGHEDHLGWNPQGDGKWFWGLQLGSGTIYDGDGVRSKTALKEILDRFGVNVRLTPQKNILLCDIEPSDRDTIESVLAGHDVPPIESLSHVRRWAAACPGLPMCSSAITEGDRLLNELLDKLEGEVARLGLSDELFSIRMTGCPFGCTRSYLADIALVGRTVNRETGQKKFALFLGGDRLGRRLNRLYKDLVPVGEIISTLLPVLHSYKHKRHTGESLGDFCCRIGVDELRKLPTQPDV